jgi:hypothetical protein
LSHIKFKKGDLVVHGRGTEYPYDRLQGVIVKTDFDWVGGDVCRVFWYTTGRYQNLSVLSLKHLDTSLT